MQKKIQTEPYISTYLHSKGRRLGLPISGNFELTSRCNFNCPMCYVHQSEKEIGDSGKRELTSEEWLQIARDARDRGMVFALLTGGEPLVRKDFFEIYDGMKKLGLLISINTNASLLQGEILERFLKDPPHRFNISLYGGCDETYKSMCGLPVYEKVKANIASLRKAGVEVSLNLCITRFNRSDLRRIYEDAVELDVNVRSSSYSYPPVRINGETYGAGDRFSPEESAACTLEWDELRFPPEDMLIRARNYINNKYADMEDCPVEEGEGVRCRAGSSSFWVTWDGRMLPCGMMTRPEAYPLEDGFDTAWKEIREATSKIRLPVKCQNCSYKEICGACAAVCLAETGSFDEVPEYMCKRTLETLHLMEAKCAAAERKES